MAIIAIYNPICGDGTAKCFFEDTVIPLLNERGKAPDLVASTERADHAGSLVVRFLEEKEGEITVVLGSGDGTLHEIINTLSATNIQGVRAGHPPSKIHFILVPCGTANALYHSFFKTSDKLRSVHSFLEGGKAVPLTLAITTLSTSPGKMNKPKVTVSAVVTSTALHAAILHDSESLRYEHPGLERFKLAAQKNASKWYNASVKLLPAASTGFVQTYDPDQKMFVVHPESEEDDPIVDIYGPFAYFLSTVNVDRLESAFRIAPLATDLPSSEATCDIVIVRPERDPSIALDNSENRAAFVTKLWSVMSGAYSDGSHIGLRYGPSGDVVSQGQGPTVVEYIRCGGWEWMPDDIDDGSHLLCADGNIFHIEKDGRAVCTAATPDNTAGFMVYV